MYGKCGRIEHARWTFDNMPERNIFSWNAMLAGYAQHGNIKELMQLLHQMMQEGMVLDRVTFISAVSVCANQGSLHEGKRLHASIMGSTYEADVVLQNALVSFYAKCGNKEEASSVFHAIQEKNLITWNAIIAAFAHAQQTSDAMEAFIQMQAEGVLPDEMTFSSIFSAFGSEFEIFEAKFLHACVTGCVHELDIVVRTAIITMYGNCGSIEDARMMFDKMDEKNVSVWNAMITAYSQHGDVEAAISLFYRMLSEDQNPDKVTFVTLLSVCADEAALIQGKWIHEHIVSCGIKLDLQIGNSLVNLYGKCGTLEDALEVFCKVPESNLVSWSSLITSYTLHDLSKEALHLFEQMLMAGVFPDKVILSCILPACAMEAAMVRGREIHHCIISGDFEMDVFSTTALLNMYSKCGSMKDAQRMFDRILVQSLVLWNSLIAAYAHHGDGVQVIACFNSMLNQGFIADECTFYSVLSACSHAGLLEEGLHCFSSMVSQYYAIPKVEHFNCMMDLFGRAGQIDRVDFFLKSMPLQPTGASWMTLLGACRLHLDRERGKVAATEVFDINPEDATPLVLLSNVYTSSGNVQGSFFWAGTDLETSSSEQL